MTFNRYMQRKNIFFFSLIFPWSFAEKRCEKRQNRFNWIEFNWNGVVEWKSLESFLEIPARVKVLSHGGEKGTLVIIYWNWCVALRRFLAPLLRGIKRHYSVGDLFLSILLAANISLSLPSRCHPTFSKNFKKSDSAKLTFITASFFCIGSDANGSCDVIW